MRVHACGIHGAYVMRESSTTETTLSMLGGTDLTTCRVFLTEWCHHMMDLIPCSRNDLFSSLCSRRHVHTSGVATHVIPIDVLNRVGMCTTKLSVAKRSLLATAPAGTNSMHLHTVDRFICCCYQQLPASSLELRHQLHRWT